ncbi:MAG: class II fumarate hydratase [Candidatus Tectomicrobia bacterium]|uniref:Fumarate hydratase class II n=1 Tax=Tectimicrobiota bacterium TaxID=2528274 RepID=A0A932M254_UNCTE|nr:class II fumarate hydratase [Candidatus Tectomicrobia bacterium]
MDGVRVETDSLGPVSVPAAAYYGAQTQRAVDNFPISGLRFPRRFIRALGLLKRGCAQINLESGGLDEKTAAAILQAAGEVAEGKFDEQFVVDIFQTGSGTSTNMNANEVIANRAIELLGGEVGSKKPVHPNDHVNMGQSSNDVIPTAIHVAALEAIERDLLPALAEMRDALEEKSRAFDSIVKIGRTHLQDAVPVRLGQEFGGYAAMIREGIRRVHSCREGLRELALGGTAVGTGLNAEPGFSEAVIARISEDTRIVFRQAANLFEALGARDAVVEASGALKCVGCSLMKIANDIRWLGSGPRCGIGEILIPDLQPGSSIMPGKVNPVMPEMLTMVAAQVIGNDAAITIGGQGGNFELNVYMPVMGYNLLQSIELLARGTRTFTSRCIRGLEANRQRCEEMVEKSLAMCTALAPRIGYDAAAAIAKEAYTSGRTVREVAREKRVLPEDELNAVLDPRRMTEPGIPGA